MDSIGQPITPITIHENKKNCNIYGGSENRTDF